MALAAWLSFFCWKWTGKRCNKLSQNKRWSQAYSPTLATLHKWGLGASSMISSLSSYYRKAGQGERTVLRCSRKHNISFFLKRRLDMHVISAVPCINSVGFFCLLLVNLSWTDVSWQQWAKPSIKTNVLSEQKGTTHALLGVRGYFDPRFQRCSVYASTVFVWACSLCLFYYFQ